MGPLALAELQVRGAPSLFFFFNGGSETDSQRVVAAVYSL